GGREREGGRGRGRVREGERKREKEGEKKREGGREGETEKEGERRKEGRGVRIIPGEAPLIKSHSLTRVTPKRYFIPNDRRRGCEKGPPHTHFLFFLFFSLPHPFLGGGREERRFDPLFL
ncbi:Genetic suppressor element 1, partial [Ophiophagus hannah]